MSTPSQIAPDFARHNFIVGDCVAIPTLNRIMRAGKTVQVEPKVMQVFVCLASRGQEVVSKQELLDEVWPGTFVSDHVLSHVLWQLRKALGSAELIETVPRRGYRLTTRPALQEEPMQDAPSRPLNGRRRWLLASAVGLAVLFIGAGAVWVKAEFGSGARAPVRRMLIVPFESTGTGAEQRVFVAGINQSLRQMFFELRAVQFVSSRTTAAILYTGGARKPLPQLAGETRSEAILQGTAAVIDGRVRIGLELWDARANRTTYSETFERELKDLLPLYGEIVRKVAAETNVAITDAEAMRLGGPALNSDGVREYLLGLGQPGVSREAVEHCQRAIALNPQFAPAYVAAAVRLRNIAHFDSTHSDAYALAEQARAMARKGLELDPKSALAAGVLATVESRLFWNWKEAGRRFDEAEKLRPLDQVLLHDHIEYLVIIRQCDRALALVNHEMSVDPIGVWPPYYAHWIHYQCGQIEAAINDAQAALVRDPSARWVHFHNAYAYALAGHYPEAIAECEKADPTGKCGEPYLLAAAGNRQQARATLATWERNHAPGPFFQALGYVGLGERERAFERLSKGYAMRDPNMRFIWDPALAPLRDDPRFRELACKMDLPPGGCIVASQRAKAQTSIELTH